MLANSTKLGSNRIVDSSETNCPDPLIKKMIFIFNMKRQINLIHCLFDQKSLNVEVQAFCFNNLQCFLYVL